MISPRPAKTTAAPDECHEKGTYTADELKLFEIQKYCRTVNWARRLYEKAK